MLTPVKKLLHHTLNFCLPPRCLLCYELTTDPHGLCVTCWQELDFISHPFCKSCGTPFEFKVEDDLVCMACFEHPPLFDQARSVVIYSTVSKHLLLAFKHGDMLQASKIISRWMMHTGHDFIKAADLIVPVPLHPLRLLKRQYNQAAVLTNELSQLTGKSKKNDLLKRSRYTVSQGRKDYKDRRKNVKSAFEVPKKWSSLVKDKNILLIDDVVTTGATVDECSKALKKAGAGIVNVLTFARVIKPGTVQ